MRLFEFIKNKKGITVACLSLLAGVIAFGGASGILAYQTDSETANNVVTVGEVKIALTEPQWDQPSVVKTNILPHQEVVKDPTVTNTGINDAVIFMKVTTPYIADISVNDDRTKNPETAQEVFYFKTNGAASVHANDFDTNWVALPDYTVVDNTKHTKTYVFGYNKTLQGSDKTDGSSQSTTNNVTTPLFKKVQLRNFIEKSDAATTSPKLIKIDAYAIQANNIYGSDGSTINTTGTLNAATLKTIYSIYVNQNS